jgi:hypothetical protein
MLIKFYDLIQSNHSLDVPTVFYLNRYFVFVFFNLRIIPIYNTFVHDPIPIKIKIRLTNVLLDISITLIQYKIENLSPKTLQMEEVGILF